MGRSRQQSWPRLELSNTCSLLPKGPSGSRTWKSCTKNSAFVQQNSAQTSAAFVETHRGLMGVIQIRLPGLVSSWHKDSSSSTAPFTAPPPPWNPSVRWRSTGADGKSPEWASAQTAKRTNLRPRDNTAPPPSVSAFIFSTKHQHLLWPTFWVVSAFTG